MDGWMGGRTDGWMYTVDCAGGIGARSSLSGRRAGRVLLAAVDSAPTKNICCVGTGDAVYHLHIVLCLLLAVVCTYLVGSVLQSNTSDGVQPVE